MIRRRKRLTRRVPLRRGGSRLKRTRIARESAKRRGERAVYATRRVAFLAAHPLCEAWGELPVFESCAVAPSRDVHHRAGRTGKNYLDESTWLAVYRGCHRWIHEHPGEARKRGLLA